MNNFKKIDYDLYTKIVENQEDISDYLVDRVNFFRDCDVKDFAYGYDLALIDCESPIEQLLSVELYRINLLDLCYYNPKIDVMGIEIQKPIPNTKYIVDFLITVAYSNKGKQHIFQFIVECDGHEFHQKTKEQVERDNIRARELQRLGYELIRFSGTEIYHKSYRCAKEILKIIVSKLGE